MAGGAAICRCHKPGWQLYIKALIIPLVVLLLLYANVFQAATGPAPQRLKAARAAEAGEASQTLVEPARGPGGAGGDGAWLTGIRCAGACCSLEAFNRSCAYSRVYLHDGAFIGIVPLEARDEVQSVRDRSRVLTHPHPKAENFGLFGPPSRQPWGASFNLTLLSRAEGREFLSGKEVHRFEGLHAFGCDLHGNFGHSVLEHNFGVFLALLRLGFPPGAPFRYGLLCLGGGHPSTSKEFKFSSALSGRGDVLDLPEIARTTCTGRTACVFDEVVAGSALIGLASVDASHAPRGFLYKDAMWQFRNRIFANHGVQGDTRCAEGGRAVDGAAARGALARKGLCPLRAILVTNKRRVLNLQELATYIGQHVPHVQAEVVNWPSLNMAEQLRVLAGSDIYITGVGTGLMNAFLMPAGAVVIQLGEYQPRARGQITYFDSHVQAGFAHVHSLWYPGYAASELRPDIPSVSASGRLYAGRLLMAYVLQPEKLAGLVERARELVFGAVPVDLPGERNPYDYAWQALVEHHPQVMWARTGQTGPDCRTTNVDTILWTADTHPARSCLSTEELRRAVRDVRCRYVEDCGNATTQTPPPPPAAALRAHQTKRAPKPSP